jgi:hypothetical protein
MQAVRDLHGAAVTRQTIDPDGTLAFDHFTYRPEHYIEVRERLNELIINSSGGRDADHATAVPSR